MNGYQANTFRHSIFATIFILKNEAASDILKIFIIPAENPNQQILADIAEVNLEAHIEQTISHLEKLQ